ncbi:MAG: peptidoglycan DD-metalloendopeptidase family protein, partial [Nanoarchaeota archaeon]|nr:peptidoglycan DD-metalloendopeptidase family protein [Nanoarchaeota archaeon]
MNKIKEKQSKLIKNKMQTIENQNIEEKREKQREEMNRKQNKKAYVFNVFMLIVLLVILTSAFIILKGKYDKLKDQSEDDNKEFGKIAIFRYYEEGERIQFFYDQAMKYAVEDALYSFANAGGYYAAECGFYNGTNLWHSNGQDCIPKIDENFAGFLGESLNKYAKGYLPKDYTVELPKTFTVQSSGEYVIAKANEDLMITKSKGTPELIGAEPQIPAQQASFSGTFEWPTDGKTVLHCFGMRSATRPHEGVDIDTENGPVKSPIFAAAAGEITAVKTGCVVGDGNCGNQGTDCGRGYGNCVYIKHSNELGTKYAHLTDVSVKIGDFVEQGQQIGTGGNTGHSFGDHLHYEVRYNGEAKNPLCMYQNTKDGINLLSGGNPRCYKDKSFTGSCPPAVSNDCGNEAVRLARQKIGSAYDYNSNFVKDTNTQVFSCSSFVYWSYAQMGIEMPVGGSRSIEEAIWGRDSGYAIGKIGLNANFNDDFNKLQPGDVLFFAGKIPHKDQGLEIGHVGIYTGDGNMIDANVPEVKEGPLGASRKGSLYRGAIRPCLAKPDAKAQITTQSTVQNLNPSAAGAVGGNPAGEAIKNEAKKILDAGTKYVYCGRTAAGVDCLGLPYLAMKNAGLIGDDSKTETLFSEGYGVYYTYGEPVTAGALTSSSGESDTEIHHEIQKNELDYLQPGDILFFTSTGDQLFTPGSQTVARMISRDKVLNIGHLGVYFGKKDDKCHEYMEASGRLNDGAKCGVNVCDGGDCK